MNTTDIKEFGVSLLTQAFQPQGGLFLQQGQDWKLNPAIPGIEAIKNRSFRSPVELMQVVRDSHLVEPIVSYYHQQFEKTSNVTGLRGNADDQSQTATKKAV